MSKSIAKNTVGYTVMLLNKKCCIEETEENDEKQLDYTICCGIKKQNKFKVN